MIVRNLYPKPVSPLLFSVISRFQSTNKEIKAVA